MACEPVAQADTTAKSARQRPAWSRCSWCGVDQAVGQEGRRDRVWALRADPRAPRRSPDAADGRAHDHSGAPWVELGDVDRPPPRRPRPPRTARSGPCAGRPFGRPPTRGRSRAPHRRSAGPGRATGRRRWSRCRSARPALPCGSAVQSSRVDGADAGDEGALFHVQQSVTRSAALASSSSSRAANNARSGSSPSSTPSSATQLVLHAVGHLMGVQVLRELLLAMLPAPAQPGHRAGSVGWAVNGTEAAGEVLVRALADRWALRRRGGARPRGGWPARWSGEGEQGRAPGRAPRARRPPPGPGGRARRPGSAATRGRRRWPAGGDQFRLRRQGGGQGLVPGGEAVAGRPRGGREDLDRGGGQRGAR